MKVLLKYKKYSQIIFWLWLVIIIVSSSLPQTPNLKIELKSGYIIAFDYFVHFVVYFVLALLFFYWKSTKDFKISKKSTLLFILLGIVAGIVFETIQLYIPGRAFNINDIYANSTGVILGVILPRLIV